MTNLHGKTCRSLRILKLTICKPLFSELPAISRRASRQWSSLLRPMAFDFRQASPPHQSFRGSATYVSNHSRTNLLDRLLLAPCRAIVRAFLTSTDALPIVVPSSRRSISETLGGIHKHRVACFLICGQWTVVYVRSSVFATSRCDAPSASGAGPPGRNSPQKYVTNE
ncbi:hypothetical protein M427DRAFT_322087 [Gonapodya prolifera JEL478]|uniref:Uncharacterized protein n=1 Tax=Gonapodya prolifera (strain JEL478) TaxID=1344416 RepID=A0A139AFI6_GONPJ|nr:hypothetical protein M427DRAFT_322087 [Gonapodya prolifera JEL478]|eukprot:KXS15520.1 hypothetical protein M427DRAFT_322087 [Gonapodya prolifera JEL478]